MLRRLLVSGAHYILGPFAEETRTYGVPERRLPPAGARTQRNGRWWLWPGSLRCYYIVCG
jgi:hypothetical protein